MVRKRLWQVARLLGALALGLALAAHHDRTQPDVEEAE